MGNPEGIRDEHREAFRSGRFDEIPSQVLHLLREKEKQAALEKEKAEPKAREKKGE